MKPSKPHFYLQETPDSCVPACLRMVFAGFGVDIPEADLRHLCDCTFLGADALKAVDAAQQCGFTATSKHNLSVTDLEEVLRADNYPIVFVDLRSIDGIGGQHALVVTEMNAHYVTVLDPLCGERLLRRANFLRAWAGQRRLTILVQR